MVTMSVVSFRMTLSDIQLHSEISNDTNHRAASLHQLSVCEEANLEKKMSNDCRRLSADGTNTEIT